MITSTLAELASWCGGTLHGPSRAVRGVGSDSRAIGPGALFVAIAGERVDGHDFVPQAAAAGAAGALVQRLVASTLPQIAVGDSTLALGQIAGHWLQRCPALRIGLTGSNGKTTVKTLLHAILGGVDATYANPGNRNNELGLPLAALDVSPVHRYAIFEMGAGKPGDIAYLCGIARPQIALVNNIAPAHLERLGSLEGVAQTKGAIYSALPDDGIAVINADDVFAPLFESLAGPHRIIRCGLGAGADVRAVDICCDADGSEFQLLAAGEQHAVRLQLSGEHNVRNALAAAALALAAGATPTQVATGLAAAMPVHGRLLRTVTRAGVVILDDSYNANPGSFAAGIRALRAQATRAWVVMGDMAELGATAPQLHAQIGQLAAELGIERLYAVGAMSRHAVAAAGAAGRHFESMDALNTALAAELEPGVTVLVKGSRSSGMERVVDHLNPVRHTAPTSTGVTSC